MKCTLVVAVGFSFFLSATTGWCNATASQNVNSRYTVQRVELTKRDRSRISKELRKDLEKLVGQKFDQEESAKLARRMRKELRVSTVSHRAVRAETPDHVNVVFESQGRRLEEDADITKLAYHSKQGWTGGIEATVDIHDNALTFGVQSDADELLERYAGINGRFSRPFGDRVRLRFDFQRLHQQWNRTTILAAEAQPDVPGIYRTRDNYAPSVSVLLAPWLTWTAGVSFQHFETQFPTATTEAANAVTNTLRYRERWDFGDASRQEVDVAYGLRAATRLFDSDFVFTRHSLQAEYAYGTGQNVLVAKFATGSISGAAPLFERFSLGNTKTLRGWNKFDIAPLGGNRSAHSSIEYRHRDFALFYDAGSVWDDGQESAVRHSAGAGFHWDNISIALAFPLRANRVTPVFLISANF